MSEAQSMKIAELERVSGVSRSTIHHYLNIGLLPRPEVRGSKLHLFGQEHVSRLDAIQVLRSEGWALPRIRDHLARARAASPPPSGAEDDTRQRIVEHATRLFADRGYDGVRISEVARALGIGKATIYRYFPSKQALFVDCVEKVRFTLVPKDVREASDRQGTLDEQGERRARAVLEHFDAYRMLTHLLGSLGHGSDPELAAKARKELHWMITNAEPLIRRAIAEQRIRSLDPELLAYMLWGALIGAGERLTLDGKYSLEKVLREYLDFAALGLSGSAGGSSRTTDEGR
jgi:AcrR family transcriptional regulator